MLTIDKHYDLFISYAHKDNLESEEYPISQLVTLFRKIYYDHYGEEINIFFDADGLKPGELWENKLLESLRKSVVMVVILSNNYYDSEYCYKEWRHFQDVEIHYSLPGNGIIAIKYGDIFKQETVTSLARSVWIQDLNKRQYCDIINWNANRNSKVFRECIITVCEQINDRKQRLVERKKIQSNIRPHNINFTGRTQEIREIHSALVQSSVGVITAIKGIGGIGKSTVAYEYAHAYIDYYQGGTFNFNTEGQDDFRFALASIAAIMKIEFTDAERKNLDIQCQRIWGVISKGPPVLLILDNVDKPDILKRITEFAADRHKLHILITSRQGFVTSKDIQEFRISPLEQSLSLGLLLKLFPAIDESEWKAANSIALRLGGHPLALTMVGTYLANRGDINYAIQLRWLEDEGIQALNIMSKGINLNDYAEPILTKIFGQVFSLLIPIEMRVLEYAALLPPDSIPLLWLFELVKDEFPEIVSDPQIAYHNPWKELVQKLERLQLVLPFEGKSRIGTMHRLIQDVIRQCNKENSKNFQERILVYAESRAKFLSNDGWIPQENRWEVAPLDAFLRKYLCEENIDVTNTANLIATTEISLGLLNEAKHILEETICIRKKSLDSNLAFIYSNLGIVERKLGNLVEAKQLLKQGIALAEKYFDSNHSHLADIYSALGNVERRLGNLVEAKRLHEKALTILEKCSNYDNHNLIFHLACSYSNLGNDERELGNLSEAKQLYKRAIIIFEKHNIGHHYLATCYSNLGNVELDMGNLLEAKRLYEQAVEIRRNLFDSNHPDLAESYHNLSLIEFILGNMIEAWQLCMMAITIFEKHTHNHLDLANSYSGLAMIEYKLGSPIETKRLYKKSIAILEKHFGPNHLSLAIYKSDLSIVEQNLGNLEEAIRLSRMAFLIFLQSEQHEKTRIELNRLLINDPNIEAFLAELGITISEKD